MPFEGLGLHANIVKAVKDMGYTRPSPIQAEAIPKAIEGRDLIGTAQTGTGKTAAFLLPILHRMSLLPMGGKGGGTRGVVLAPTRELAVQTEGQLQKFAKYTGIRSVAIYGGANIEPQRRALRAGVELVIATPGRFMDHIERKNIRLDQIEFFVLDEADRMLDMGFLPDIRTIVSGLPKKRQTMLFSATMPREILKLASEILIDPVNVQIGETHNAAAGVRHAVYPVPRHLKTDLLLTLLRDASMVSVLVFIRTKHSADRLVKSLVKAGFSSGALHSNRTQSQRLHTLDTFRKGQIQVLVATDIAARGIDVANITHVINLDVPNSPETYLHRVGRTARAENVGDAFTLVSADEEKMIRLIEKKMGPAIPRIKLPDFNYRQAPTPMAKEDYIEDSAPRKRSPSPYSAAGKGFRPRSSGSGGYNSGSGSRPEANGNRSGGYGGGGNRPAGNSPRPNTGTGKRPQRGGTTQAPADGNRPSFRG